MRLTPPGPGAVATVRVTGDASLLDASPPLFRAVSGLTVSELPVNAVAYGRWGTGAPEDVVLCRMDGTITEIHCHGGRAAPERILADLRERGCDVSQAGATADAGALPSLRDAAPVAGEAGVLEAECVESLTAATTLRTADILLQQQSGLLRQTFEALIRATPDAARQKMEALRQWSPLGLHLTRPWSVVLCGRPNVGKSSLINALVGYSRSIVFDQPGTTRDVVTVQTVLEGWPIALSDTAGLRDAEEELERSGIDRARRELAAADLRIVLLDVGTNEEESERQLLREWPDALVVAHKSDLPNVRGPKLPRESLAVSSRTGEGVEQLAAAIVTRLVPRVPPAGTPIPFTPRQVHLLHEATDALAAGDADWRAPLERLVW